MKEGESDNVVHRMSFTRVVCDHKFFTLEKEKDKDCTRTDQSSDIYGRDTTSKGFNVLRKI